MAKTIPFNIRLKIDGKDMVVSCHKDVEILGEALGTLHSKSKRFQRQQQMAKKRLRRPLPHQNIRKTGLRKWLTSSKTH